jgi:hypothetical protein
MHNRLGKIYRDENKTLEAAKIGFDGAAVYVKLGEYSEKSGDLSCPKGQPTGAEGLKLKIYKINSESLIFELLFELIVDQHTPIEQIRSLVLEKKPELKKPELFRYLTLFKGNY